LSDNAAGRLWNRTKEQFAKEADHLVSKFIPEADADPLKPNDSYLRVSLSEFFLADEKSWGSERVAVANGAVRLNWAGSLPQTFTTLVKPPVPTGHGVFQDYLLTEWLPYWGQRVELEASLYQVPGKNNLLTAIDIVCEFSSLVTPPMSAALAVVDKVASGIEKVIEANAKDPVLVMHSTLRDADLRPGWLVVIGTTEKEVPASTLGVDAAGRLTRQGKRLTGHDFIMLRVEACQERDDWRTPDLDAAIASAIYARDLGRNEEYRRLREDALGKIYLSPDLTPRQRKQAALLVKEELDEAAPGAAAEGGMTIAEIVGRRGLPSPASVVSLTLEDLLA
jgi:hypothetical protein